MPMTPQEELFAKFFNNEKELIINMSDLELTAHRSELSKIAFEARARLTAIQEETGERSAKRGKNKQFQSAITTDEITSDAITAIDARKAKLSKTDKQIEALVSMGVDRDVAIKMFEPATLLALKHKKPGEALDLTKVVKATLILTVENHKCPECGHGFDNKLSGNIECPQCKSKLNLLKTKLPKSIKGKCPTCLFDFDNKVEGITTCPKCETKCEVIRMITLANPFDTPVPAPAEEVKLIEAQPVIVVPETLKEEINKTDFNPFA